MPRPAGPPSSADGELPCVIDIEASGFGRHSYPIEIGYVMPDGRPRCTLIRPAPQWQHWDERAQQVHQITRELIERCGRPPAEVATMLNDDLAGRTVYCDGWAHDYPWLSALFEEAGITPRFRLESVRRLFVDDAAMSELTQARQDALQEMKLTRHRASNDALGLQRALQRLGAGRPRRQPA